MWFQKERIELEMCVDEGVCSYASCDVTVHCGTYTGCSLEIESVEYLLEPVDVKHYSVEVDIYIDGKLSSIDLVMKYL